MPIKPCQLCSFVAPTLKYLLKHLRQVHAHQPGFEVTCFLSRCQRKFRNFTVFRNHVYAIHSESESILRPTEDGFNSNSDQNSDPDPNQNPTPNPDPDPDDDLDTDSGDFEECMKKMAATWILKIQEKFKLPQLVVELILQDVTDFFDDLLDSLFSEVKLVLSSAGIDDSVIVNVSKLFGSNSAYGKPFAGLETQYLQLKYYKKEFGFVVCSTNFLSYTVYELFFLYPRNHNLYY